jgi:DNA-binding XRE family transcriptional regulator
VRVVVDLDERNANVRVGAFIRRHREELGYSQKDLGEFIGVAPSTISGWETGRSTPSWHRHEGLLARHLNFDVLEMRAVRWSADPVEQAIRSQPGLTRAAQVALVEVYRVLLRHKRS